MICFDTNIIIYIAIGSLSDKIVTRVPIFYPSIVRIESLGYANIRSVEEQRIRQLLATLSEVPLTESITERAIQLRQNNKMSLGDSIVAATAIERNCELWTANTSDFEHIAELKLYNPMDAISNESINKRKLSFK